MQTFVGSYMGLINEAWNGATREWTWFADHQKGRGLKDSLASLTAEQASLRLGEAATLAAHANHVRFYFEVGIRYIKGEQPKVNWDESWAVQEVDEAQWRDLRAQLESSYEAFIQAVKESVHKWDDKEMSTGAFSSLAHTAYHLGAVRQMIYALGLAVP